MDAKEFKSPAYSSSIWGFEDVNWSVSMDSAESNWNQDASVWTTEEVASGDSLLSKAWDEENSTKATSLHSPSSKQLMQNSDQKSNPSSSFSSANGSSELTNQSQQLTSSTSTSNPLGSSVLIWDGEVYNLGGIPKTENSPTNSMNESTGKSLEQSKQTNHLQSTLPTVSQPVQVNIEEGTLHPNSLSKLSSNQPSGSASLTGQSPSISNVSMLPIPTPNQQAFQAKTSQTTSLSMASTPKTITQAPVIYTPTVSPLGVSVGSSTPISSQPSTPGFATKPQVDDKRAVKRKIEETLPSVDPQKELDAIKAKRIQAAAAADRQRVLHPDYVTPFASHEDAWQRLLSYHILQTPNPNPKIEKDKQDQLLKLFASQKSRFKKLKESFSQTMTKFSERSPKEEQLLLEKLTFLEEKLALDTLKSRLQQQQQPQQPGHSTQPVNHSPITPTSQPRAQLIPIPISNTSSAPFKTVQQSGVSHSPATPLGTPPMSMALKSTPQPVKLLPTMMDDSQKSKT